MLSNYAKLQSVKKRMKKGGGVKAVNLSEIYYSNPEGRVMLKMLISFFIILCFLFYCETAKKEQLVAATIGTVFVVIMNIIIHYTR